MPVRYRNEDEFLAKSPRAKQGEWHDFGTGWRGKDVGPEYAITWYPATGAIVARKSPSGEVFLLGHISTEVDHALEGYSEWTGPRSPFGETNGMDWLVARIKEHGHLFPDSPGKNIDF